MFATDLGPGFREPQDSWQGHIVVALIWSSGNEKRQESDVVSLQADWLRRVDAVEPRLAGMARPLTGLTSPDPVTADQWEAGQVWGHLSEFVDFWIAQFETVIAGDGPVPFGRPPDDTRRPESLEKGKQTPPEESWATLQRDLVRLREFLTALDDRALGAVGVHPRLGEMRMPSMVDQFLVGHLEEHADQLDELA